MGIWSNSCCSAVINLKCNIGTVSLYKLFYLFILFSKKIFFFSLEFEDSACVLNAVQSHCKVHIRSKKSQLTFLEEHLKSLEELSWNPRLKCFLWCSNTGPLVDARLAFNKVQPHDCLLSIFAR